MTFQTVILFSILLPKHTRATSRLSSESGSLSVFLLLTKMKIFIIFISTSKTRWCLYPDLKNSKIHGSNYKVFLYKCFYYSSWKIPIKSILLPMMMSGSSENSSLIASRSLATSSKLFWHLQIFVKKKKHVDKWTMQTLSVKEKTRIAQSALDRDKFAIAGNS